jgi:hypothetical protein
LAFGEHSSSTTRSSNWSPAAGAGDRPETTAALRSSLEALPVKRWTDAEADAWWDLHASSLAKGHAKDTPMNQLSIEVAQSMT